MTEVSFKLLDYAWGAITVLGGVVWGMLNNKINDHKTSLEKQIEASNAALSKRIDECNDESDTQRGHIGKIFDKLEQNSRESQSRHIELLNAIHTGLAKKADK